MPMQMFLGVKEVHYGIVQVVKGLGSARAGSPQSLTIMKNLQNLKVNDMTNGSAWSNYHPTT